MDLATLFLTPVLALALLVVAVQVARLVRGWVRSRGSSLAAEERRERIALEDEKERLVTTLSDLEFEHSMGRLSDADYRGLRRRLERRTVEILERLEAP